MPYKPWVIALVAILAVFAILITTIYWLTELSLGAILSPIFSTSLALVAAFALYKAKNKVMSYVDASDKNTGLVSFAIHFVFGVSLFVLAIPVLSEFGVPTASLVTILGTSSLAIGLALRNFLSNIAAGMMILVQRPFDIGHMVEINGTVGVVEKIDLFSTRLRTSANEIVHMPNGKCTSDKVINKNIKKRRRLEVRVTLDLQSNLTQAKTCLEQLVDTQETLLKSPAPIVVVDDINDKGVVLLVRMWVNHGNFSKTKFEMLEQIKLAFDKKGIALASNTIP